MPRPVMSAEPLDFNPLSPAVLRDPYPFYDRFRTLAPVYKTPLGDWFLTRYDDVTFVLRDRRFGRDFTKGRSVETLQEPVHVAMSRMVIYLNPPDHTRVRGVLNEGFARRLVEDLRPLVRRVAERLLRDAVPRGQMDIVRDFAFPLPLMVICELLGIPQGDRHLFMDGSALTGRAIDATPMTREELDRANARVASLEEYFRGLFEARRHCPANDLSTHLLQAAEGGSKLSERELFSNVGFLFNAGHETTASMIGNALIALHRHPETLARLRANSGLMPQAVEELIRYDSSVQFSARVALEDTEIGGQAIRKGDILLASLGGANRDPAANPNPNVLDIERVRVRSTSFGGGVHYCLGAQLARMELEVALSTLLETLPTLRLQDVDNIEWKQSFVVRGAHSLPATW